MKWWVKKREMKEGMFRPMIRIFQSYVHPVIATSHVSTMSGLIFKPCVEIGVIWKERRVSVPSSVLKNLWESFDGHVKRRMSRASLAGLWLRFYFQCKGHRFNLWSRKCHMPQEKKRMSTSSAVNTKAFLYFRQICPGEAQPEFL